MNFKAITSGAVNLAIRRWAGPFHYRRRWLARTEMFDAVQIRQLQSELFKRLVSHSYRFVPFYRELMDARGFGPDDIKSVDDIKRFPILRKKQVLQAGDSMRSRMYPRFLSRKAHTGGTTGTPMDIYRSPFSIGNEHAFVRRQFDWAGVGLRDRCAYLTGRIIANPDQAGRGLYAYDPFMRELILSTYHLTTHTAVEYVQAMKRYKVKAVSGYPSAVYLLARTCQEEGIKMDLQAAFTSSEVLSDVMRDVIQRVFRCRVFDFYGSAERVCYVFTCGKGSYHILPEYGLTELLPADGKGNCRVVATGFWNMAMPLIRYDTGDTVVPSNRRCDCGREFEVVGSIGGRCGDEVVTPSGRRFGSAILTHLLYGVGHIVESQIVQDSADHVRIDYVPDDNFDESDSDDFKMLIKKHLPSELRAEIKEVQAVKKTSSGKVRPVVSQI